MPKNTHDMQVNVAGIRRNLKNIAHNYSDAQKKVREATCNDHWGPSSRLMSEIADLTYNVVAFSEIMQMLWKRLNDHGKNWRHVYKALVLLEYLIKTGSEKVGQQCKENIFAIQTLKDFQYLEEGKDQGQNVREKAKQLVNLLKDDERLKAERARALKAKERFAQSASGFGSDGGPETPTSPRYPAFKGDWNGSRDSTDLPREIEIARPQTAGEEELQLQLALAMSREEAEQEEQKRKSDDVRLQLALSQSQQDFKQEKEKDSHMVDLLDVSLGEAAAVDPWGMPQPPSRPQQSSPWQPLSAPSPPNVGTTADPWQPVTQPKSDPWGLPPPSSVTTSPVNAVTQNANKDPWSPVSQSSSTDLDEFDIITNRNRTSSPKTNGNNGNDPFELNLLGDALSVTSHSNSNNSNGSSTGAMKKTPQSFLGENSALVNLDNLVTKSKPSNPTIAANPFSEPAAPARPIFNTVPPKPTINEIKQQSFAPFAPLTTTTALNPNPYAGLANQFTSTQPTVGSFGGVNGTGLGVSVQDPWTPVVGQNANGSAGAVSSPWTVKSGESTANPFLS